MSKARDLADSVAAGGVLADGAVSLSEVGGGTSNGVVFVNGSGTTTSGSALTFNGSTLDVTGTVVADGLTVATSGAATIAGTDSGYLKISHTSRGGDYRLQTSGVTADNLRLSSAGKTLGLFGSNGDISFYEDTGTTPKFFWDASAESLGIGTSSLVANRMLTISGSNGVSSIALVRDNNSVASGTIDAIGSDGLVDASIGLGASVNGITFSTGAAGATEKVRIDSAGELTTTNGKFNLITVGRGAGAVASNTAVGASALAANTSGIQNAGVGANALQYQTNNNNTALGYNAMLGVSGVSAGGSNTAVGSISLAGLTTGNFNTAIGQQALQANTTASSNTAVGYQAGYSANGVYGGNAFFGYQSGLNSSTAYGLAFFGDSSGLSNTTGINNVALGVSALRSNTTASNSTAVGYQASYSSTLATGVTSIGYQANYNMVTTGNTYSTAVGYQAAKGASGSLNYGDVAVGAFALTNVTTGANNVAMGYQALLSNTTASANTAIGFQAGYSNTTGNYNTMVGRAAGLALTTGSANTFVGGYDASTGGSGAEITTGSNNTIIGAYNGNQGNLDICTANNYIVLSDGDGNPRLFCNGSGDFFLGTTSSDPTFNRVNGLNLRSDGRIYSRGGNWDLGLNVTSGTQFNFYSDNGSARVGAGNISSNGSTTAYNTTSDYRLKQNIKPLQNSLYKVLQLKPCSYNYIEGNQYSEGFVAHELQAIIPQAVTGEKDAVNADGSIKAQGVDASFLVVTLTAAIQELKAEFDEYKLTHP
jgi:hypothetical protein